MDDLLDIVNSDISDISEPVRRRVAETFNLFLKTVKAKLVYPSSSRLPQQFKEELHASLSSLVEELESVTFKVEADRILFEGTEVYRAQSKTENFAHPFFRDGILSIQFKKGLQLPELESLIDIISRMMRSAFVDDDLATMLWESGFEHISYKLMDDILDIETFEYGTDSLKSKSAPSKGDMQKLYENEISLDFNEEDFNIDSEKEKRKDQDLPGLDVPDAAAEFIKRVTSYDDSEMNLMKELLEIDAAFDHRNYVINLLFEILGLETDNVGYHEALELIAKVRDDFVRAGDFISALTILTRTRELEQGFRNLRDVKLDKIEGFIEGFASSDKIRIIADALNQNKDINHSDVAEYLKMLPWQAITPLVNILGDLVHFPARRAVCKALETLAVDKIELLGKGIDDFRWYVVRNVVTILGKINNPKALSYFKRTIRHPDIRVRKETVVSAARIGTEETTDFLIMALSDQDEKLQILALKELARMKVARAYLPIQRIVADRKFKDRSTDQVREFLESLALIGGQKSFELIKKMATRTMLMPSEKEQRLKNYAIRALGLIQMSEATKLLEKIGASRNHDLADAALRALNKKLKGD